MADTSPYLHPQPQTGRRVMGKSARVRRCCFYLCGRGTWTLFGDSDVLCVVCVVCVLCVCCVCVLCRYVCTNSTYSRNELGSTSGSWVQFLKTSQMCCNSLVCSDLTFLGHNGKNYSTGALCV
jgi:hypothetical protein